MPRTVHGTTVLKRNSRRQRIRDKMVFGGEVSASHSPQPPRNRPGQSPRAPVTSINPSKPAIRRPAGAPGPLDPLLAHVAPPITRGHHQAEIREALDRGEILVQRLVLERPERRRQGLVPRLERAGQRAVQLLQVVIVVGDRELPHQVDLEAPHRPLRHRPALEQPAVLVAVEGLAQEGLVRRPRGEGIGLGRIETGGGQHFLQTAHGVRDQHAHRPRRIPGSPPYIRATLGATRPAGTPVPVQRTLDCDACLRGRDGKWTEARNTDK